MSINILIDIFVFVFGVCIGSFLNCVIFRLEQKEKMTGRSHCLHCKNTLSWKDLFPVLSFVCLGGKCRYCKGKISWQYPIVEIATGILFVFIFSSLGLDWRSGFGLWDLLKLCFMFYVASVLVIIFVYDLRYYIIPDKVLLPAIGITFLYRLFVSWQLKIENLNLLLNFIFAAVIASGFFLFVFLISKGRWMGFGDVKLAILMGFFLGLPNVLVALFLAFFFGAIIGTIMMIFKKKSLKSEMPFGPFLITGTFTAMLYGNYIIQWYLNLFQI